MTLEQNIKQILECNFPMVKDEVIESTTQRIIEQINRQTNDLIGDIIKKEVEKQSDVYIC